jgi:hypothetical protein
LRGAKHDILAIGERKPMSEAKIVIPRYSTNLVAWVAGRFMEVVETSNWQIIGESPVIAEKTFTKPNPEEAQIRAAYRAQKEVRRLINTNELYYMWTLTFAINPGLEGYKVIPVERQKSRKEIWQIWKFFLRRMQRRGWSETSWKWLSIMETHDSFRTHPIKRGTYHIHLATDREISERELAGVWAHGMVNIQNFSLTPEGHPRDTIENPGAYISKYIAKDAQHGAHEKNQKRYSTSRNLEKPLKYNIAGAIEEAEASAGEPIWQNEQIVECSVSGVSFRRSYRTYFLQDREEIVHGLKGYLKRGGDLDGRKRIFERREIFG